MKRKINMKVFCLPRSTMKNQVTLMLSSLLVIRPLLSLESVRNTPLQCLPLYHNLCPCVSLLRCYHKVPQIGWCKNGNHFIVLGARSLKSSVNGIACFWASVSGVSTWLIGSYSLLVSSHCLFSASVSFPNVFFLQRLWSHWIRVHMKDLILTRLSLERSCLQIR